MKYVFCKYCKYSRKESDLKYYDAIYFKNDSLENINDETLLCMHEPIIKCKIKMNVYSPNKFISIGVDNPYKLNKNYDCKFYKPTLRTRIIYFIKDRILK